MYLTLYLLLEIIQNKNRVPDTYYINNHPANVVKFVKFTSNSTQCKNVKI